MGSPVAHSHAVEVLRDVQTGSEDGTPVVEETVIWTGAGNLDDHRAYGRQAKVDTKSIYTAVVFLPWTCPAAEDDRLRVTRRNRSGHDQVTTWRIDNIEDFESIALLPEREAQCTRVVNA